MGGRVVGKLEGEGRRLGEIYMSGEGRRRSKEGGNEAVDLRARDIWAADFGMERDGAAWNKWTNRDSWLTDC